MAGNNLKRKKKKTKKTKKKTKEKEKKKILKSAEPGTIGFVGNGPKPNKDIQLRPNIISMYPEQKKQMIERQRNQQSPHR